MTNKNFTCDELPVDAILGQLNEKLPVGVELRQLGFELPVDAILRQLNEELPVDVELGSQFT